MPLPLLTRLGMYVRRVPVRPIAAALREAEEHDLPLSAIDLEVHTLCGGDPRHAVQAMRALKMRGIAGSPSIVLEALREGLDPEQVLLAPETLPPSRRPITVLRSQAPSDPEAAVELATRLIASYNASPATSADLPNMGPLKRLVLAGTLDPLIAKGRKDAAAEILAVLAHVPPAQRAALPALRQDG